MRLNITEAQRQALISAICLMDAEFETRELMGDMTRADRGLQRALDNVALKLTDQCRRQ